MPDRHDSEEGQRISSYAGGSARKIDMSKPICSAPVKIRPISWKGCGTRTKDELRSESLMRGATWVPPGGGLVPFRADHAVTGGYPAIGCVEATSTSAPSCR